MSETFSKLHTHNYNNSGEETLDESRFSLGNEMDTGATLKNKDQFVDNKYTHEPHTVIVKKTKTKEFDNFKLMTSDTPVCHLLYEDIDNGSFYLQWKQNTTEQYKNSVLMMIPSKTVPKFKLNQDGGRALFSNKVAPDKNKFYSSLCQFLKQAKDYNSKFQLMPGWNVDTPYKCDLYLHYEDNKVVQVENEHVTLDNVNCVAVVGTSTKLSTKMTKEQIVTAVRNTGYSLTL